MNIQLLKWGKEYNIHFLWNFLYLVPLEQESWYEEMADFLLLIAHLQAPTGYGAIFFDRFSEYYDNQEKHGLKLKPRWIYQYIYPFRAETMADLAYTFEDHSALAAHSQWPGFQQCLREIEKWFCSHHMQTNQEKPALIMEAKEDTLVITDTRECRVSTELVLDQRHSQVYLACDSARAADALLAALNETPGTLFTMSGLEAILAFLVKQRIVIHTGDRYLSLAIPKAAYLQGEKEAVSKIHPGGGIVKEALPVKRRGAKSASLSETFNWQKENL